MIQSKHQFSASKRGSDRTHEGTVLLVPGCCGERVFRPEVVPELNRKGFNTVDVDHARISNPFTLDKTRLKDIDTAAMMALEQTGDPTMHVIVYSKGGADVVNFFNWFVKHRDRLPYNMHGFAAVAAISRGGASVRGLKSEALHTASDLARDPIKEGRFLIQSAANIMVNPVQSAIEALGCFGCDMSNGIDNLVSEKAFVTIYETFGTKDRLVPAPIGWMGDMYEGGHKRPVSDPSIMTDAALRIAA